MKESTAGDCHGAHRLRTSEDKVRRLQEQLHLNAKQDKQRRLSSTLCQGRQPWFWRWRGSGSEPIRHARFDEGAQETGYRIWRPFATPPETVDTSRKPLIYTHTRLRPSELGTRILVGDIV